MLLAIRRMCPILGILILCSGVPGAARGQAAGEPATPLVLGERSARDGSAEARRQIAEALIAQREAIMGRGLDPGFRARLVQRVAAQPIGRLRMLHEGGADAPVLDALGDSSADLLYTPLTNVVPCRIFDTRLAAAGMLTPNVPRNFLVAGDTGFAAQGGYACGVPLGPATAVVLNLAVVGPTGPGHLRAWPAIDPPHGPTLASVLNFGNVAGLPALANALVLPICDRASAGGVCVSDLSLQTFGSSTHVVGDVLGYFTKVDLPAELPIGADSFGPVAATASSFILGPTEVLTPARPLQCVVTCSMNVASSAPNATGQASIRGGGQTVPPPGGWLGGWPMFAAPVASAGSSSATQIHTVNLGSSLRFQFGCLVEASGDFLGDEITGTVAWICR
jgi:hypothetical protein